MENEGDSIEASVSCFDESDFIIEKTRWLHVLDRHNELREMIGIILSAASDPDEVFIDSRGALHIVKKLHGMVSDFLVVIGRRRGNSKTYLVTAFFMNSKRKQRRYRRFKKLALS